MTRLIGCRLAYWGQLAALLLIVLSARTSTAQSADPAAGAAATPGPAESARPERLLAAAENVKVLGAASEQASPVAGGPQATPLSEAEQITSLQKAVESDSKRAEELRRDLVDPKSEYRKAEAAFKEADDLLTKAKTALAKLMEMGTAEEIAKSQADVAELERTWELSRERFNLVLESRKTSQELIVALEEKIRKNNGALQKLLGTVPEPEAAPPGKSSGQESPPGAAVPAMSPPLNPSPVPPPAAAASSPVGPPALTAGAAPPDAGTRVAEVPATPPKAATKKLIEAQTQVSQKEEEAVVAKEAAQSVAERIAALDKDIGLENKLLVAARKKSDLAFQTRGELDREEERLVTEGAAAHEIRALHQRRREAEGQFSKARLEVSDRTDRLNDLQTQRAVLQREALAAATTVERKQQEVNEARHHVAKLQNPFSPHNVLQWLLDHGPRISVILLAILMLRFTARMSTRRITSLISQRGTRGTLQEREDRARTLVGVFRNAFSITTTVGGTLMICEEIGIAVGPLMGGAAVLGLAVAFGAQNLIRDYFYGFVILIENQYKLNDVLKIGNISGQVEQITLRMTVLRDQEGNVHFIPNGKIDSVTNMSHGWSRARIEVNIAYKENVDRCMGILMDLAEDLQKDPDYSNSFLDRPEMLGVESLGESAVQIRFLIKTRPLHQWRVKREMLRRIKRRFDEMGIEIPCLHRALNQREGAVAVVRGDDLSTKAA